MKFKEPKLRVGISSCLYGNQVRYDGTHRLNRPLLRRLGPLVEWIVVCPEADSGMGVPRETIHLVGSKANPRVETTHTKVDKTKQLRHYSEVLVKDLSYSNLSGFVLKARSPSCGTQTPLTLDDGTIVPDGRGIFVQALYKSNPRLPIVNEEDIATEEGMENFVEAMKNYVKTDT